MVLKRASIVVFVSGILLAIIAFHIRAQEKSPEKKSDDKPVAGTKAGSKTEAAAKSSADSSTDHKNPFTENVKVTFTDKYIMVESDGIPNHPHGEFPNPTNPNTIKKQNYKFYIPLAPKPAEKPTKTPFGPIGVAINGIPFYNQYNAEGGDAVKLEVFDSCCGHPDPMGRYHYHKYP
ncbi:MAG TPA: YHYH protein, partial [Pirellulales bacterium]